LLQIEQADIFMFSGGIGVKLDNARNEFTTRFNSLGLDSDKYLLSAITVGALITTLQSFRGKKQLSNRAAALVGASFAVPIFLDKFKSETDGKLTEALLDGARALMELLDAPVKKTPGKAKGGVSIADCVSTVVAVLIECGQLTAAEGAAIELRVSEDAQESGKEKQGEGAGGGVEGKGAGGDGKKIGRGERPKRTPSKKPVVGADAGDDGGGAKEDDDDQEYDVTEEVAEVVMPYGLPCEGSMEEIEDFVFGDMSGFEAKKLLVKMIAAKSDGKMLSLTPGKGKGKKGREARAAVLANDEDEDGEDLTPVKRKGKNGGRDTRAEAPQKAEDEDVEDEDDDDEGDDEEEDDDSGGKEDGALGGAEAAGPGNSGGGAGGGSSSGTKSKSLRKVQRRGGGKGATGEEGGAASSAKDASPATGGGRTSHSRAAKGSPKTALTTAAATSASKRQKQNH
jgi:hypothetical protein